MRFKSKGARGHRQINEDHLLIKEEPIAGPQLPCEGFDLPAFENRYQESEKFDLLSGTGASNSYAYEASIKSARPRCLRINH